MLSAWKTLSARSVKRGCGRPRATESMAEAGGSLNTACTACTATSPTLARKKSMARETLVTPHRQEHASVLSSVYTLIISAKKSITLVLQDE